MKTLFVFMGYLLASYFLMSAGKLTDIFLSIESKKGFHVQQQYVFDYFYYFYTYYFRKRR